MNSPGLCSFYLLTLQQYHTSIRPPVPTGLKDRFTNKFPKYGGLNFKKLVTPSFVLMWHSVRTWFLLSSLSGRNSVLNSHFDLHYLWKPVFLGVFTLYLSVSATIIISRLHQPGRNFQARCKQHIQNTHPKYRWT